jgi:tetratricopeptide (TPR) repeat protein
LSKRRAAILLFLSGLAIVLSLTGGWHSKEVDNAAHVGGLCFGLILGASFAWVARSNVLRRSATEWRTLMFATFTLVGLLVVLIIVRSDVVELGRGERASDNNDYAGAIPHLQRFVIKNPGDLIGHGDLGYAYGKLNRNEEAAREYRRMLEIDRDNPVAQYNLAWIYTLNDPDRAIPLYRASLPRLPKNSDRFYDFAIALHKAGNLEEAESVALKALSLDPHSELKQGLFIQISVERAKQRIASERAQQRKE